MKEFSLKNKVILITGGYGLIGKEVCDAMACAGASLVIIDKVPKDLLQNFCNNISKTYQTKNNCFSVDITDEKAVFQAIADSIKMFCHIDVLINLAAIDAKFDDRIEDVPKTAFENFPMDLWKKSVDVNITGTFIVTQAVVREMIKCGSGNIINVASTYSLVAPNQNLYRLDENSEQQLYKPVDYVATKSMIPGFTKYLATFYGKTGIRANTIVPHGIFNNHSEQFVKNFRKYSPIDRMCDVKELRGPFVFLSSDASSYMTGSTLTIDGGWTAW